MDLWFNVFDKVLDFRLGILISSTFIILTIYLVGGIRTVRHEGNRDPENYRGLPETASFSRT